MLTQELGVGSLANVSLASALLRGKERALLQRDRS